jgi:hypothetical protein
MFPVPRSRFPVPRRWAGFAAHWVRVKADADGKATAWFTYDVAQK